MPFLLLPPTQIPIPTGLLTASGLFPAHLYFGLVGLTCHLVFLVDVVCGSSDFFFNLVFHCCFVLFCLKARGFSILIQAVMIKHHRLGDSNNRNLFPHSLGG